MKKRHIHPLLRSSRLQAHVSAYLASTMTVASMSIITEGRGSQEVFPKDCLDQRTVSHSFGATTKGGGGKTYDQFNLSILKPPTAKPRQSSPNDFFIHIFGKKDDILSRQVT